jgi:hypothetical protein
MNLLKPNGLWHDLPEQVIKWGGRLGFVGCDHSGHNFVFPLAKLLSHMSPKSFDFADRILRAFGEKRTWQEPLRVLRQRSLDKGFSRFRSRTADIVKAKNGLSKSGVATLTKLSKYYNISRERIRQIERSFWRKLLQRSEVLRIPFVTALLCDFISEGGRLVIDCAGEDKNIRSFLAKCAGIDNAEIPDLEITLLGASERDIRPFLSKRRFSANLNVTTIIRQIENQKRFCLISSDSSILAERICAFVHKHMSIGERVCIALRKIGRPAHYAEITNVHNSIFTNCLTTDDKVHGALLREKKRIVWIGSKGTFAMKEWGYKRPSANLCDTIATIVRNAYEHTNRPVPFTVIQAEIGKHRYKVNQASLVLATALNPKIRQASKNAYVPRSVSSGDDFKIDMTILDRLLSTIEQKKKR